MRQECEVDMGRIVVMTAIPLMELLDLEIRHQENAHGNLIMHAIISKVEHQKVMTTDWSKTGLTIFERGEEHMPLFNGCVERLSCQKEEQFMIVELHGVSNSVELDRKKKNRSFQDTELTYKQVVNTILNDYHAANVIWQCEGDKKIGEPLIQYNETDWEFIKRLCSHFHSVLVTDLKTNHANFFFGLKKGVSKEKEQIDLLERGYSNIFYTNGCYEEGMPRSQTLYMDIETNSNWQMGDYVIYDGRCYRVYRRHILYNRGELRFLYRLGTDGMYYKKVLYNESLPGLYLEGTIKGVEGEFVYLHLNIDKGMCASYPWPWKPETTNFFYCMPEIGTKAVLYLPTHIEREAIAVLSPRLNCNSNVFVNPQSRELVTKNYKKIGLYPERMFLESGNGSVIMSMSDNTGIKMESNKNISLCAEGNVHISGESILIEAPFDISLSTNKSNIEISKDFNFYAPNGVKTKDNGEMKKSEEVFISKEADEKIEHWRFSFIALASIPAVDFAIGDRDSIVDLVACAAIPKIENGSTIISLEEVMAGKKEYEISFPDALQSMERYSIKGGYRIPNA